MMPLRFAGRKRRAVKGIADAAISSVGNLAVSLSSAHYLDIHAFGTLATLLIVALLIVGLIRVRIADPYVLLYSARPEDEQQSAARRVLGSALVLVTPIAAGLALVGTVLGPGSGGAAVLVLAATIPMLAIQDVKRSLSYAVGDVNDALVSTCIWTFASMAGTATLILTETFSPPALLAVWGVSAGIGAAISLVRTGTAPNFCAPGQWADESRSIGIRSLLDFVLTHLTGYGSGLLIAAVAGAGDFGALRVAQLPFALVQVAITGSVMLLQPRMVIQLADGEEVAARRLSCAAASGIAVLVGVITLALVAVPTHVGAMILGASWTEAQPLVPVVGITLVASAVAAAFGPYLRAVGDLRFQVGIKTVTAPITLAVIALSAATHGALGGAAAQAAGVSAVAILSGYRALRRREVATAMQGNHGRPT